MLRGMMGKNNIKITMTRFEGFEGYFEMALNGVVIKRDDIPAHPAQFVLKIKKGDVLGFAGGARVWRYDVYVDGVYIGQTPM